MGQVLAYSAVQDYRHFGLMPPEYNFAMISSKKKLEIE